MNVKPKETLMSVKELAEFLNVSPGTVYRLVEDGEVPNARVGGQIRFSPSAIEAWLAAGARVSE